jgi:hypothetical protein
MVPMARELTEDDVRAGGKLARGLYRCLRVRIHRLAVCVATPDPALTGLAYGMAWAGLGAVNMPRQVHLRPDFTESKPRADYRIELSARPALVIVYGVIGLWRLVLRKCPRVKWLWGEIRRRSNHGRDGGR